MLLNGKIEYVPASDLDRAWLNFEPTIPLEPTAGGGENPFYVKRPHNPVDTLIRGLMKPFYQPPKLFFSGHRGCGKSTELRRVAVDSQILENYYPVRFTIRDEGDINDLDYKDLLLAIGGRMYRTFNQDPTYKGELPTSIKNALNDWRGKIATEIKTGLGRYGGFEVEGGLDAVFAKIGLKMKLEPTTRQEIRQIFQRNITELIDVIDQIGLGIQEKTGRVPLVLIDDLDKPDLAQAKEIFYQRREVILQPQTCAIVYTVSSALFYSKEFEAVQGMAYLLPNVKLHEQGDPKSRDPHGYWTMRMFVHRRMNPTLITDEALDLAAKYSGGVFREMGRMMRSAILEVSNQRAQQIGVNDVEKAAKEIRGEYQRILEPDDLALMRMITTNNQMQGQERLRNLLQLLAVLEYQNGLPWCDVHPALVALLES